MRKEFFTCRLGFDRFARELAVPVRINGAEKQYKAIFDTGATASMIAAKAADELRLKPLGQVSVSGVHGTELSNIYNVDIQFPNGFIIPDISVSESGNDAGFDLLIGMDIISRGIFFISGGNGKSVFIFCYPAVDVFDFSYLPELFQDI